MKSGGGAREERPTSVLSAKNEADGTQLLVASYNEVNGTLMRHDKSNGEKL